MLRSVVTTGSYAVEKYSRSYPSPLVRTQSQDLGAAQPEWQHFSNPVITLTLDVKKSMDSNFESVRLRVLWIMDMGHDGVEREITMEDLDLLSFSGTPSQIYPGQGPPLKAVYRGAVVGIRYQYPFSAPATSPAVNFASASDVAQFIDAIRPVCPCKENAGLPAPPVPANGPPVPPAAPMQPLPARSTLARYHTSAVQRPSMLPPSVGTAGASKSEAQGSSQEFPARVPRFPPYSSSDLSLAPSSDPAPALALRYPRPYPAPSLGCDRSSQPSSTLPADARSSQYTAQSGSGSAPSLPASSQPTSTAATLAPQPTPPTATATSMATATQRDDESEKQAREAFLESLREAPELYSLTRQELENLVSVVVREPGFPRLLEALDSMWAIRGFLAQ